MSRLRETFRTASDRGGALIIYLTAGYPTIEESRELFITAAESGADVLEVGVPFSDPIADGPVIQKACHDALQAGANMEKILGMVSDLTARIDTPLVMMTCYNPILAYGQEAFGKAGADAGLAGVLIADLPPSESASWCETAAANGLETVFLVAPTTPRDRLEAILKRTTGFVYVISTRGVTGERDEMPPELPERISEIRRLTDTPVAVGFGISKAEHVRTVCSVADGAVVGSAVLRAVQNAESARARIAAVEKMVSELARGCE